MPDLCWWEFSLSCIFTDLIMHYYWSNQSVLMTRCGTDFRHQYGIFCGESQTSFTRNTTRAESKEGRLFSQASVGGGSSQDVSFKWVCPFVIVFMRFTWSWRNCLRISLNSFCPVHYLVAVAMGQTSKKLSPSTVFAVGQSYVWLFCQKLKTDLESCVFLQFGPQSCLQVIIVGD